MVKRKLTGAHYGVRDWLFQRMTAVTIACYTIALLLFLLFLPHTYEEWKQFFAQTWVRIFTQVTFIAIALHIWIGIRDVWMDYIKHYRLRLTLHSMTVAWLVGCIIYSIKVIWGV